MSRKNFEKCQTIHKYRLYCGIMSYINEVEHKYNYFCQCIYAGNKEKKCEVSIFRDDLLIFAKVLDEINDTRNIPKLYKTIKRF